MRVNGKPTDTISQKAPPGGGAKFGRSIVMGLPGRWQTRHPNAGAEPLVSVSKTRPVRKSPAEAGLSRSLSPSKRACPPELSEPDKIRGHSAELRTSAASLPTQVSSALLVAHGADLRTKKAPRRGGAKRAKHGLPTWCTLSNRSAHARTQPRAAGSVATAAYSCSAFETFSKPPPGTGTPKVIRLRPA